MFVLYDWPFPHMCTVQKNVASFPFNFWLSFQRLCRLLWGFIFSMLPLVSRINSRLPSVNHALISPVLTHPVLRVALLLSVPSTHQFHHPSSFHSFIPVLKPFSTNPSDHSLPFLLPDWLHGFSGLFTDTCEHIVFSFSVLHFLVVGSVLYINLTHVIFWLHVTIAYRIISYKIL